tara:strand:+ start:595 stop:936 length:342 start_codon:yes stop_codon:yes gene_type:complete
MYGTITKASPAVADHRGVPVRFALRVEYGEVPYMVQQEFSHGPGCDPAKGWHDMTGHYSATLVLRHMIEAIDGQPCEKCGVYVPASEYHGADKPSGETEYLCPDCPSDHTEGA